MLSCERLHSLALLVDQWVCFTLSLQVLTWISMKTIRKILDRRQRLWPPCVPQLKEFICCLLQMLGWVRFYQRIELVVIQGILQEQRWLPVSHARSLIALINGTALQC